MLWSWLGSPPSVWPRVSTDLSGCPDTTGPHGDVPLVLSNILCERGCSRSMLLNGRLGHITLPTGHVKCTLVPHHDVITELLASGKLLPARSRCPTGPLVQIRNAVVVVIVVVVVVVVVAVFVEVVVWPLVGLIGVVVVWLLLVGQFVVVALVVVVVVVVVGVVVVAVLVVVVAVVVAMVVVVCVGVVAVVFVVVVVDACGLGWP